MTGDYTIVAVCAPVAVVALELTVLRTGILWRRRCWGTIAITLGFQVAVDGWLTKLSAPIVLYRQAAISGARWPWAIPPEDFGFALAMIMMTLALWERALRRERARTEPATGPVMSEVSSSTERHLDQDGVKAPRPGRGMGRPG